MLVGISTHEPPSVKMLAASLRLVRSSVLPGII